MSSPSRSWSRRQLLATGAMLAPSAFAGSRIDRSRVSAITDEIAKTPAEGIQFARQYGLKWLELRKVPGAPGEYFMMDKAFLEQAAKEFRDAGVRVSFLNTSMLKYWLPGTEPARANAKKDPARYEKRKEELERALEAAHILGVNKVRVFTFTRTTDPAGVLPRVSDAIAELAEIAGRSKTHLLIENEPACNVGGNAELVSLLNRLPSRWVGINWDPLNAQHTKEIAFPDGYRMLPARRIENVQIKGKSVLPGPELMDWVAIFRQLAKDGYKGQVGLETHIFGEIQVQKSHESIKEILRLLET